MQEVYYSFEEYLALEETANEKHEYQDGEIVSMTGGTTEHNKIALNFASNVKFTLKRKQYDKWSCKINCPLDKPRSLAVQESLCVNNFVEVLIFIGDVKLWIPTYRQGTYPDVMLIEGESICYGNGKTTVMNPSLIVEAVSYTHLTLPTNREV